MFHLFFCLLGTNVLYSITVVLEVSWSVWVRNYVVFSVLRKLLDQLWDLSRPVKAMIRKSPVLSKNWNIMVKLR